MRPAPFRSLGMTFIRFDFPKYQKVKILCRVQPYEINPQTHEGQRANLTRFLLAFRLALLRKANQSAAHTGLKPRVYMSSIECYRV